MKKIRLRPGGSSNEERKRFFLMLSELQMLKFVGKKVRNFVGIQIMVDEPFSFIYVQVEKLTTK